MTADELVGAEQRFQASHFGGNRLERKRRDISFVGDQRDVRIAGRRRNTVQLADLAIRPHDVGRQTLVDVAFVDKQEFVPLLRVQAAVAMSCLGFAEQFRGARGAHVPNLVLHGEKGAALIPEGLDYVAKLLRRLTELGVSGHLCLGTLDDELRAVGGVIRELLLLLPNLGGEASDKAFLFELDGNPVRDVGDRLGFALARLPEP